MNQPRCFAVRRKLLLLPILVTSLLAILATPNLAAQQKQGPRSTTVVAWQDCITCHEDVTTDFAVSPHGKAAQFLKGAEATSCETCHGDTAKHNMTADPADISSPSKLPAAQTITSEAAEISFTAPMISPCVMGGSFRIP